jgi:hypothetical protein
MDQRQATEVVFLPLKESTDPKGAALHSTLEKIVSHGKPIHMWSGPQIEHPTTYNLFIDWNSIEHHMEYTRWE